MSTTWVGDWRSRVIDRIAALGFASIRSFCQWQPSASVIDVAATLGDDVAPVQVESVFYEDALRENYFAEAAGAALVRRLHTYLPAGVRTSQQGSFSEARVFAGWSSAMGDEFSNAAERTWMHLRARAPDGWLPVAPDDPVLAAAFREEAPEWLAGALCSRDRNVAGRA